MLRVPVPDGKRQKFKLECNKKPRNQVEAQWKLHAFYVNMSCDFTVLVVLISNFRPSSVDILRLFGRFYIFIVSAAELFPSE